MTAVFTPQLLAAIHKQRIEDVIAGRKLEDDNVEE